MENSNVDKNISDQDKSVLGEEDQICIDNSSSSHEEIDAKGKLIIS